MPKVTVTISDTSTKIKKWYYTHPIRNGIIIASTACIVYFLIMLHVFHVFASEDKEASSWITAGTFGDMFGCLNTWFSALGYIGIIYTIFLQRKTLANVDRNEKQGRAQNEKHWYFSQVDRVNDKWANAKKINTCDYDGYISFIIHCIKDECTDDEISKLADIVKSARASFIAYNVILYSLAFSKDIPDTEARKEIIEMTRATLDEDLQFCLCVLAKDLLLAKRFKSIREEFSEKEFVRRFCKSYVLTGQEQNMSQLLDKVIRKVRPHNSL